MAGLYNVYALVNSRKTERVVRFLDKFVAKRTESALEYLLPHNSDNPTLTFGRSIELLQHLEEHPHESHAVYWCSSSEGDPRNAMVFPTTDGEMIFGLSVETCPKEWLYKIKDHCSSELGYIDFEKPPPESASEFRAFVVKSDAKR